MHPYLHKPLPPFENVSDVSSIAPSQSASQIGHMSPPGTLADPTWRISSPTAIPTTPKPYTIHIPPAHSISEHAVPNGITHPDTIAEETGGSSVEEEEANLEVHENPRFNKGRTQPRSIPASASAPPSRHISFSVRTPKNSPGFPSNPSSYSLRESRESPTKRRGVLGGLAALFHVGSSRKDSESSPNGSPSKRWQTRIDRNLASSRRDDNSDDDGPPPSHMFARGTDVPQPILLNSPTKSRPGAAEDEMARLRRRAAKRGSVQTPPAARMALDTEKGYASDTVTESISKARAKSGRKRSASKTSAGGSVRIAETSGRLKKPPAVAAVLAEEGSSLSRNSSVSKQSAVSAASAPPRMSTAAATQASLGRQNSLPRKRVVSLDPTPPPKATSGHKRTASVSVSSSSSAPNTRLTLTNGEPSLMSIVEGISKLNRQAAMMQDPNRMLVVPKAPPPVSVNIRDSWGEVPVITRTQDDSDPALRERSRHGQQGEENNYRNSLLLSGSVSAPSLPLSSTPGAGSSKPLPNPVKTPLRSALRNPSRTPSPAPAPAPLPAPPLSSAATTVRIAPIITQQLTAEPPPMKRRESDISSISSYETGHEMFDDAPDTPPASSTPDMPPATSSPRASPKPMPPLPPLQTDVPTHPIDGSEVSQSTESTVHTGPGTESVDHGTGQTQQQQPPRRRKSVRMSLPPTFSATPPAIDDTDEDDGHAPWSAARGHKSGAGNGHANPRAGAHAAAHSPKQNGAAGGGGGGWGTRIEESGARDVWEDSSDEDAEYSAARRMLAKFSRKHERS